MDDTAGSDNHKPDDQVPTHPDGPPLVREGYVYRMHHDTVVPAFIVPSAVDELRSQYVLDPTDIVVATYPKCGTTWMQQILLLLLSSGNRSAVFDPMSQAPWLEAIISGKACDKDPLTCANGPPVHPSEWRKISDFSRIVWKTHATPKLVPWAGGMEKFSHRVIVVSRNAKDAAVSMYHHTINIPSRFDGDWDKFSDLFCKGWVESGSYWEWYKRWAAHSKNPQILWVKFEDLKSDLRAQVERIAKFVGCEVTSKVLDNVAEGSTFEAMKEQQERLDKRKEAKGAFIKKGHIREGRVGGWKDTFNDQQTAAFNELDEQFSASDWANLR